MKWWLVVQFHFFFFGFDGFSNKILFHLIYSMQTQFCAFVFEIRMFYEMIVRRNSLNKYFVSVWLFERKILPNSTRVTDVSLPFPINVDLNAMNSKRKSVIWRYSLGTMAHLFQNSAIYYLFINWLLIPQNMPSKNKTINIFLAH